MPQELNAEEGPSQNHHIDQSSPERFAQLAEQVIRLDATERASGSPPDLQPHMAPMKAALVANAEALLAIMDRTSTGIAASHATGEGGNTPHNTTNPAPADSLAGSLSSGPTTNT